jgi:hypothetical protein
MKRFCEPKRKIESEKSTKRKKRRENQHIRFGSVWVNLSVNLGISQIGSRLKPLQGGERKTSKQIVSSRINHINFGEI